MIDYFMLEAGQLVDIILLYLIEIDYEDNVRMFIFWVQCTVQAYYTVSLYCMIKYNCKQQCFNTAL